MRRLLIACALLTVISSSAQNYTDIMALLQADLRNEKHAIVLANLDMSAEQRDVFMPIYDQYSAAMRVHWDKRLALVDDFAKARDEMSDKQALSFMSRLSDLEREAITIRGDYEKKMVKVLPATLVARWVQMERRVGQLMELQIANEVPLMPGSK